MENSVSCTSFSRHLYFIIVSFIFISCGGRPDNDYTVPDLLPKLEPDYSEITIPPNIAPLNFIVKENGTAYMAKFTSATGPEIQIFSGNGKIIILK